MATITISNIIGGSIIVNTDQKKWGEGRINMSLGTDAIYVLTFQEFSSPIQVGDNTYTSGYMG